MTPRFDPAAGRAAIRRCFGALLGFALAMALAGSSLAAGPSQWAGVWRVVLADFPGGGLPFGLEIAPDGQHAWLLNPPERLTVERVSAEADTLTLAFPSYGSTLTLAPDGEGGLKGAATLQRRAGAVPLAITGERDVTWRFEARPAPSSADVTGRWIVRLGGTRPETGLAQLTQAGNGVTGSIQFPTGDTRYLAGEISGGALALSTFDGNAASVWRATLADGSFAGKTYGATDKAGEDWTATRDTGQEQVSAVTVETREGEPIDFRFPDADGSEVALSDARFRGKVVLVAIGGAWCPNCHDEARFLGPYARAHEAAGLEVIGLQFERGDEARARAQVRSFAVRYDLPYPLLLAGQPTPESTKAALPFIGGVKVYPSLLLIDRNGRLREVHVGYAGPATGALHEQATRELDEAVQRLLAEPAPG